MDVVHGQVIDLAKWKLEIALQKIRNVMGMVHSLELHKAIPFDRAHNFALRH